MAEIAKILRWPSAFVIVCLTALFFASGSSSLQSIKLTSKGIEIAFYLLQAQKDDGSAVGPKKASSSTQEISATAQKAQNLSFTDKRVLWVDDNPSNNRSEQRALQTIGLDVDVAKNIIEASERLQNNQYSVVITDFLRRDDREAAYTLLKLMRDRNYSAPLIIYSASATPEYEKQAIKRGAFGETNVPARLYELVISALQKKKE